MTYELNTPLNFGKYKGKTIQQLLDMGTDGYGYIAWAFNEVKDFKLSDKAFKAVKKVEQNLIAIARKIKKIDPDGLDVERIKYMQPKGEYAQMSMNDFDDRFEDEDDYNGFGYGTGF